MKILPLLLLCVVVGFAFFWWKNSFALPVFCTTRGCVTTIAWDKERGHQLAYANATASSSPDEAVILTTLVRRHLITHVANNTLPRENVIKYRENILRLTNEEHVQHLGFATFAEYDDAVVLPFLLQQSYMDEHSLASPQEAYAKISQDYWVLSLLFDYTWDSSKGEIITRD